MSSAGTTPLVSVLMAVRNAARHLPEAIDSVLAQTLTDFEFVIVDDGSTDDTARIIEAYDDPRIVRVTNAGHPGLSAALNFGATQCRAPLLARMDGDDICPADAPGRAGRADASTA